MKNLQFDQNGYLLSDDESIIEISLETLENHFDTSTKRRWLLGNYLRYIAAFQDEVFPYFEQWINGSFISQTAEPKDIDIVTFLDYQIFEKRINELDRFLSFSREEEGLDTYIVKDFPSTHPKFADYQKIRELWKDRFGFDRFENPKAFVKIVFEKTTAI